MVQLDGSTLVQRLEIITHAWMEEGKRAAKKKGCRTLGRVWVSSSQLLQPMDGSVTAPAPFRNSQGRLRA
eukprot:1156619-Pelagomonas_calceolata.AAC.11